MRKASLHTILINKLLPNNIFVRKRSVISGETMDDAFEKSLPHEINAL